MEEIIVRKTNFQTVGYILVDGNGDKTVMNFYKRILGRYDASSDTVRDFYGNIVARGDAAAILLKDEF